MTLARFRRLGALLVALNLSFSIASAAPFMNIDFEGDVPGSAPTADLTPDNPMTKPSAIGGYTSTTSDNPPTAANGTILVGGVPGIAQGVIMTTNPSNAVLGALWMDNNGFNVAGQQLRMSFDVNILQAPTNATTQPKILNGGTAGILLGMNAFTNSGSQQSFRFAAAPTSDGGGVFAFRTADNLELIDFFNYVEGQTYNVAIEADYTTGNVRAFVDGVLKISNHTFLTAPVAGAVTGEYFFHLNGEAGYANMVALDNIQSSVIPEPASAALAGAAALGLFVVRRRRLSV
jgi:MYXO-CTERM domain-containing protein